MNIAHYLAHHARHAPDRPAVYAGNDLALTYAGLLRRAQELAGSLVATHDLAPGDRLAIFLRNSPAYLEALCAAWHAGLVVVPINAKLSWHEVAYILEDSGARVLIADRPSPDAPPLGCPWLRPDDAAFTDASRPLAEHAERDGDDPAWIFYTSGTTGRPKGATLTHRNLAAMATGYLINVERAGADHVLAHFAPLSHGSGIYLVPYLMIGAASLVPSGERFDPAELVALVNRHDKVSMFLAPTMVRRLLDYLQAGGTPLDVTRLGTLVYGGGPMYARDLREALETFGPRLAQIYGQGESPMTITVLDAAAHRELLAGHVLEDAGLVPVGRPHPQVEVRLRDAEGRAVPVGAEGEIYVRGEVVMQGYWQRPEATAETLRDGWLHTGDVGRFDADGWLYLTDRVKDVIISGGTNIYPREVEEVLLRHPDVREVSVVGRPHPEWGEEVVAFVATGKAVAAAELDRFCRERMARFKRPRAYHFLDDLPKSAYGKILKTELRKRLDDDTAETP
ncbi:AMP-binding protein [Halomonas organivorans]